MRVFAASSGSLRLFVWIEAAFSKAWPASLSVDGACMLDMISLD